MNMKSVSYILGWILNIEAGLMSLPLATAVIYREKQGFAFLAVMALCAGIGYLLTHKKPNKNVVFSPIHILCLHLSYFYKHQLFL